MKKGIVQFITSWLTDLALDYMGHRLAASPEQPFLCFVSYVDPHDPCDPPEPYDRLFDAADMPEPIPAAWRAEGNSVLERGRTWLGFNEVAENKDIVRQLRAHYHGSVRLIDDQIGRLVQFLEDRGLWDNTVILFTTDHGEMLGAHELLTKGVKPYDAGVRCPLIVAGGGVERQVSDRLTCSLDFFPTLCDWAGVPGEARPPLEGKSFAHACADAAGAAWESVQVAFGPTDTVFSADGWRLTVFAEPHAPNQLINLREDPTEQHNRYDDPACAEIRTRLFEQLVEHHVRVRTMPQYRNLPVVDGGKRTPGGQGNGQLVDPIPIYCDPRRTPSW